MKHMKVILASGSPRRKEILETLGISFSVLVSDVNEHMEASLSPEEFVKAVSAKKCEAACAAIPHEEGTLVIACDTVVVYRNMIIGKPADDRCADLTLHMLSDSWHQVLSGLTLTYFGEKTHTVHGVCTSKVKFRELSEDEIRFYVASGEPKGKAGSYAIQLQGASFVERIEGDYYNIVGFPVSLFFRMLREEFGILPTDLMYQKEQEVQ